MRTALAALTLTASLLASVAAAQTMKAVRVTTYGGPDVLKVEQIERPKAGPGELLLHVRAAGVNPVDWKIRQGLLKGMTPQPPFTPGYDVAGTVEALGEGVSDFKIGDEIYAYLALTKGGGYAEYVAVPAKEAAKKPKADFADAAAVPLAGLTAWQALFTQASLKEGQTVLIHGAAGGVGHFAVQFAKSRGATVIATASSANHEFLKKLGADIVIDYTKEKFEDVLNARKIEVDVVLDTVGADTHDRSYAVLKKGGTLVSIVQPPKADKMKEFGVNAKVFLVSPNGPQLAEIARLIDAGKVTPHVSAKLPLEEAVKAHELSQTGKTRGKIVLEVK
ncbi:MAG TPA: NADP-dependent oxidoreductase [Phycisphaerales bacterium]